MVLRPEDIITMQDRLFSFCRSQAQKKGNDYSGNSEDTFMNLRRVKDFKCTENDMLTVLGELVKKCSRLSNFSQPGFVSQVTEESAFDTISDLINYATYWQMFFEESKGLPKITRNGKPLPVEYVQTGDKVIPRLIKKKKPKRKTSVKPKRKASLKRTVKVVQK